MGLETPSMARRSGTYGFFPFLLLSSALSLASGTLLWVDLGTNDRKRWGRLACPKINSSVEFFNRLSPLYEATGRHLVRLDRDIHFCHQPMLMFGNHDPANDHGVALYSRFRELIAIQEERVINRLFRSDLA
jgi:hypothetical protein